MQHNLKDQSKHNGNKTTQRLPRCIHHYPIISQAADLLLKCAGFLDDTNTANANSDNYCRTYYAIDVDVIILYLQPYMHSSYLDIFGEGEKSDTALALTFLLGNFLFKKPVSLIQGHKEQKCRFLIVPPHNQELLTILEQLHRKVISTTRNIDSTKFKELTDVFSKYEKDRDKEALLANLRDRFSDLVELFDPYRGPKAGLRRFSLLAANTFRRIDAYIEDGLTLEDTFKFEYLDTVNNETDRMQASKLIEEWESRLKEYRFHEQPPYALRDDAEVLAQMEHINSNLREQDKNKKLVLITGSHYLFQAAKTYKPQWSDKESFAEMYLRHPQAFLAHEEFFPDPETFKLVDWLNLLFPDALLRTTGPQFKVAKDFLQKIIDGDYESIEKIINILARSGKDTNQILKEWRSQLTERANAQYMDGLEFAEERGAHELAEKIEELRQTDWSIKNLCDLLLKEALTSTSMLYSLTVWIGLWSESPPEKIEGIPELRFDADFEKLIPYCAKVIELQRSYMKNELSLSGLEGLLRQYGNEVQSVDQSLYHTHVIHALAFIAKGHWRATLTLAKTAMNISDNADHTKPEYLYIRGREAAYLACIAARRLASKRYWLNKAKRYIKEACKRENEGCPEDIRFTAERLTIRTREYYFDIFCENKIPNLERINATINASCKLIDKSNYERDVGVRLWVQRLICTNLFTLLLIARDSRMDDRISDRIDIKRHLDIFQSVLKEYHEKYKRDDVQHSRLICEVATAIWKPDLEKRQIARSNAIEATNKRYISGLFDRPYSKARLEMLKRILSLG